MIDERWVGLALLLVACGGTASGSSSDATSGGAGAAQGGGSSGAGAADESAGRNGGPGSDEPVKPGLPIATFDTYQFGIASPDIPNSGPARFSERVDSANPVDGGPSYLLTGAPDNGPTNCVSVRLGRDLQAADSGKRFRMRQKVKTADVTSLSLSFELLISHGKGGGVSDDMRNPIDRTVTGTTDWHELSLVLDAPPGSDVAVTAMKVCGTGRAWFGPILLEQVGPSVATTPHTTWGPTP